MTKPPAASAARAAMKTATRATVLFMGRSMKVRRRLAGSAYPQRTSLERIDHTARQAGNDGDREIEQRQRDCDLGRDADLAEEQDVERLADTQTVHTHRHHAGKRYQRHEHR